MENSARYTLFTRIVPNDLEKWFKDYKFRIRLENLLKILLAVQQLNLKRKTVGKEVVAIC